MCSSDLHGAPRRVRGLGMLPHSNCVHYDAEPQRREEYTRFVGDGMLPGYAADDGAALHFKGTELERVVTSRPRARAYRVEPVGHEVVETPLETEYLGGTGWPGLLDKHSDHDPLAVDALIYLLAVALQSPKPTATVALARGLSPASGPKRILAARKAGLLPETEPGKPAGA